MCAKCAWKGREEVTEEGIVGGGIVSYCEGKRSPNQTHSTHERERGHCPVGHPCILLFTVPERAVVVLEQVSLAFPNLTQDTVPSNSAGLLSAILDSVICLVSLPEC